MRLPNTLFDYLDILRGIETAVLKVLRPTLPVQFVSTKQLIMDNALDEYSNIVGRFELENRIAYRVLEVPDEADHPTLLELGAVREGDKWVVPKTRDLADFEPWWPLIPEDLRDSTPRLLRTKDGKSVVSYVTPDDLAKGSDSTATSLMFVALPIISALAYFATSFSAHYGPLVLLLAIPYLWAITHGEGAWTAMKTGVGLLLAPFLLAAYGGGGLLAQVGLGGVGLKGVAITFVGVMGAVLVFSFICTLMTKEDNGSVIGGAFAKFKSAMKWALILAIIFGLAALLPGWAQAAAYFAVACAYPMFYTDHNFVARTVKLYQQGNSYNLDSQGSLTDAYAPARAAQSKRAFEDTSPLLVIGKAYGWLTKRHYALAPDAGRDMCLSANDTCTHLLIFGMTNSGKTSTLLRPIAKQWLQSKAGGFLCLDGKGSLPGELSKLIDIMVKPGVAYAPFQGLDAGALTIAINSLASNDPKAAYWEDNASDLLYNTNHILEALIQHEKVMSRVSREEARKREDQITGLHLQIEKAGALGEDETPFLAELESAIEHHKNWATSAEAERKYFWSPDGLVQFLAVMNSPRETKGQKQAGEAMIKAAEFLGYEATPKRIESAPRTIHPKLLQEGSLLRSQLDWALTYWPTVEPTQRAQFMSHAMTRITPLLQGEHLVDENGRHWKTLEEGIDVDQCLYGKSVGLDLPEAKHGRAAQIIATLLKQRIYTKIKHRAERKRSEWLAEGQRPLMLMIDELQLVIGNGGGQEGAVLPIARSLGLSCIFATQSLESLEAKIGDANKTAELTNAFQSFALLKSSPRTYEWAAKRLGPAELVTFKQQTVGLDYLGGVKKLAASPLNDLNHPNRSALRKMEREGAGQLVADPRHGPQGRFFGAWAGHYTQRISDDQITKNIYVPTTGAKEKQDLFLPEEYTALLASPGFAILNLQRGGVARVDLATLNHVGEDELRA